MLHPTRPSRRVTAFSSNLVRRLAHVWVKIKAQAKPAQNKIRWCSECAVTVLPAYNRYCSTLRKEQPRQQPIAPIGRRESNKCSPRRQKGTARNKTRKDSARPKSLAHLLCGEAAAARVIDEGMNSNKVPPKGYRGCDVFS